MVVQSLKVNIVKHILVKSFQDYPLIFCDMSPYEFKSKWKDWALGSPFVRDLHCLLTNFCLSFSQLMHYNYFFQFVFLLQYLQVSNKKVPPLIVSTWMGACTGLICKAITLFWVLFFRVLKQIQNLYQSITLSSNGIFSLQSLLVYQIPQWAGQGHSHKVKGELASQQNQVLLLNLIKWY